MLLLEVHGIDRFILGFIETTGVVVLNNLPLVFVPSQTVHRSTNSFDEADV